ncbi:UNKNOWN [Stylonychia lemnae]|uniref:Uncharacterized protein n=1 Tax=Stylonychia lemnae TaxID=5949 RepID=A0A078AQQ0_STYLE|nr:UNKNOWN [Stylonychia lemnae]|eukprot:CDW84765.1 UNKNOWN [Stylonychia lemnae]
MEQTGIISPSPIPHSNNVSTTMETTGNNTLFKNFNQDISQEQDSMKKNTINLHPKNLNFLKSALKTESKQHKVEFKVDHLDKLIENASKISIIPGLGGTNATDQDQSQSKVNSMMNPNETLQLDDTLKDASGPFHQNKTFSIMNNLYKSQSEYQLPRQNEPIYRPVKINIRKLGDTNWDALDEQKKQQHETKVNQIFDHLYKTQNKSWMYKNLKPFMQTAVLNQMDQQIEDHRIRASQTQLEKKKNFNQFENKANLSKIRLEKYNQQLIKQQKDREKNLNKKMSKAQMTLEEYQKAKQERSVMAHQERTFVNRNPEQLHVVPGLVDIETQKATIETPNQVLVTYFSEHELQMIQDDPHYFITDMRYRDLITIFDQDALEAILDNTTDQKIKTFKERFYKEQIDHKNQETFKKKVQIEKKFNLKSKKLLSNNTNTRSSIDLTEEIKEEIKNYKNTINTQSNYLATQDSSQHSPLLATTHGFREQITPIRKSKMRHPEDHNRSLQKIREKEAQDRLQTQEKLLEKQKDAELKRQREQLKNMNRVLELRDKITMKQQRINANKDKLRQDHELMKNYYSKIEENCMTAQVKEIQEGMLNLKLQPIKHHLQTWQAKLDMRSTQKNFRVSQSPYRIGQSFSQDKLKRQSIE